jgi:hypothetical protein
MTARAQGQGGETAPVTDPGDEHGKPSGVLSLRVAELVVAQCFDRVISRSTSAP